MTARPQPDAARSRAMRRVAMVIAGTAGLWVLAGLIGRAYDWPNRWMALADLVAGAAFVWSLVATWRIWRRTGSAG